MCTSTIFGIHFLNKYSAWYIFLLSRQDYYFVSIYLIWRKERRELSLSLAFLFACLSLVCVRHFHGSSSLSAFGVWAAWLGSNMCLLPSCMYITVSLTWRLWRVSEPQHSIPSFSSRLCGSSFYSMCCSLPSFIFNMYTITHVISGCVAHILSSAYSPVCGSFLRRLFIKWTWTSVPGTLLLGICFPHPARPSQTGLDRRQWPLPHTVVRWWRRSPNSIPPDNPTPKGWTVDLILRASNTVVVGDHDRHVNLIMLPYPTLSFFQTFSQTQCAVCSMCVSLVCGCDQCVCVCLGMRLLPNCNRQTSNRPNYASMRTLFQHVACVPASQTWKNIPSQPQVARFFPNHVIIHWTLSRTERVGERH